MSKQELYQDHCEECSAVILRDEETGGQVGRCQNCGWHENDVDCHANPFVPLDFNED